MQKWLRILDRLSVWMGTLGGIALTALAGFTIVAIFFRYVLNDPIFGSIDIYRLSLAVMTFLALPYAGRSGGHIVVDIVPEFRNPAFNAWRNAISKLLIAVIFGLLAWQGVERADLAKLMGEASNMREIPHWRFYWVLTACAGLYALVLLTEAAFLLLGRDLPELKDGVGDDETGAT